MGPDSGQRCALPGQGRDNSGVSGKLRPSRGAVRPSFVGSFRPRISRGRGECRELAAPMARLQQKTQAAVTTGSAETSRHSPHDGWNGCFAFSPVLRAFWPPSSALRITHQHQLDISVGMPGPRDLTVRINVVRRHGDHAATSTRPPHPALNVRDDREAPLLRARDAVR
jgi:hypothetical protein